MEFDPGNWTANLAKCVRLELLHWRIRMSEERLRAVALDCHPWHLKSLTLSLLTDRESYNEPRNGKWALADWRLYDFPSGPTGSWPAAQMLMAEAHSFYSRSQNNAERALARDSLINCCVDVMREPQVAEALREYHLALDFEVFVGHPDAPGSNFYLRGNDVG